MGTSAFDIINKQTSTPDNNIGSRSAFDTIQQPKPEPKSFVDQVGSLHSFMMDAMSKTLPKLADPSSIKPTDALDYIKKANSAIDTVGSNIDKTVTDAAQGTIDFGKYLAITPVSKIGSDVLQKAKDYWSGTNLTEAAQGAPLGIAKMLLEDPVSAVTQLKNVDGVALPISSDELAQKYQSVAGTLAAGQVAKVMHTAMLGSMAATPEAAIAAVNASKALKAAKVVGTDAITGSTAGFTQGAIAGAGSDDDLQQAIAGAITFLPIGIGLGVLTGSIGKYNKALEENKGVQVRASTATAAQELAAKNALSATEHSTMADLANSMESINNSTSLTDAAIKAKFKVGQGYVIDGFKGEVPAFKDAHAYHSLANNSLAVLPYRLSSAAETFFKKNGYLPREVVSFGGDDYYIVKEAGNGKLTVGNGKLTVRNINTGEMSDVLSSELRRNNTSLVSSTTKVTAPTAPTSFDNLEPPKPINNPPYLYDNSRAKLTVYPPEAKPFPNTNPGISVVVDKARRFIDANPNTNLGQLQKELGIGYGDSQAILEHIKKGTPLPPDVTANPSPIRVGDKLVTPNNEPISVTKAGLLNPENYLNGLAQKFTSYYKKAPSGESFETTFNKFAKQFNISEEDHPIFQAAISKRLSADLSSDLLSSTEIGARERLQKELLSQNQTFVQNVSRRLDHAALTNGMYIDSEGGGRYRVRSLQDGSILKTVGSPNEALNFIKESSQVNYPSLDGGNTGAVPTNLGNIGGLAQPYKSKYTPIMEKVDAARFSTVGKLWVPSVRMMGIVDNLSKGSTSFLKDVILPLQEIQAKRSLFVKGLEPLTNKLNSIISLGKELPSDRLRLVADNVETKTPDEIINTLLHRKMFQTEIDNAKNWFKGTTTKEVSDLMYSAKEISKEMIGSPEYDAKLHEIGVNYKPEALKAALNLSASIKNLPPESFSPYAVLRLAKALEHPETALSQLDHAAKYNLTAREVQLSKQLSSYYEEAFTKAGLDPKQKISGYLPDIILHNAVDGRGSNINDVFARELSRVGITPDNLTEQNPLVAASKYHYSLMNSASGFSTVVKQAQKAALKNIEVMQAHTDPKVANMAPSVESMINRHLDDVMGRKDPTEYMSEVGNAISGKLFGKYTPDIGSMMELFSLSKIALRVGLAARDASAVMGRTYINLGSEFAKEAFLGALSPEYMQELHQKGIFGNQDLKAILDPTGNEKLLSKESLLGKTAGVAFKASGQELVYNRSLAGIYRATQKLGAPILESLRKNNIDKETAYDRLGLGNYGPAVTKIFDDFVSKGRPDQALDFLGQMHGRTLSTVFGSNNAPIGWNSKVGKLLSQYGYWASNAANTLLESATYGNKSQIAARALRTGVVWGAIAAAGNTLGVDLSSWQFANPFEVAPGTGPLANVVKDTYRTFANSNDAFDASMKTIGGLAGDFIPFSGVLKDWQRAYDANNPIAGILSTKPKE